MNRYKSIFKEKITPEDLHYDKIKRNVKDELAADVIYDTFRGILEDKKKPQEAFRDACENENLHGAREDIVQNRENIAALIKKFYGYRLDPIMTGKI